MVHGRCRITHKLRDLFGYPALGLDAKNAAQNAPAGARSSRTVCGARRGAAAPERLPQRHAAHTQIHSCARTAAQARRATRATKAAAPPPRTHTHPDRARPRRRRDITPTTAQEGDGIYTRTNGAGLASLEAGATVSVVGRLTGDSSIETSDGVQINLVEPSEAAQTMMPASGCVEVVGTVRDTGSVSPLRVAAFGDDFDLKNYDDLVGLAGDKYAALFR